MPTKPLSQAIFETIQSSSSGLTHAQLLSQLQQQGFDTPDLSKNVSTLTKQLVGLGKISKNKNAGILTSKAVPVK